MWQPHERSDMWDQDEGSPGCRLAHPGYGAEHGLGLGYKCSLDRALESVQMLAVLRYYLVHVIA
jgi:hypothetical protein